MTNIGPDKLDTKRAAELTSEIRAAFPPVQAPGDFELAPHDLVDCPDCSWIRESLSNRTWDSITSEEIVGLHQNLSLLSNRGFQSLLPACLVHVLHPPTDWLLDVSMWALFAVCPDDESRWNASFADWSTLQLQTIAAWVLFIKDNAEFYEEDKSKLSSKYQKYWAKYLA